MIPDRDSLSQLYANELQPVVKELEAKRLQLRNRVILTVIASSILPIAGYFIAGGITVLLGAIAALTLIFNLNQAPFQEYRKQFKRQIIQRLVKLYYPNLSYNPTEGITKEIFTASQIYAGRIDRYHYEDLLMGKVGATQFRLSEIRVERRKNVSNASSSKSSDLETVFSGMFFRANFNKTFSSKTIILPNLAEQVLGNVGKVLQDWHGTQNDGFGERVKLEDPEFQRLFVVYSTDQVEARYILSTSLMQRLIEFVTYRSDRAFQAYRLGIVLSFIQSNIYIAFPTGKNYFEPPSLLSKSALLNVEEIQNYLTDVQVAQSIIEELNLNRRIWNA